MKQGKINEFDIFVERTIRATVFIFGLLMLSLALPESAFAFESAEFAIEELCAHMQGNLGGLLMAAAGVGAVISGAFGNFRASYSFIIVGIGAFTVSAMLSLYFPAAADKCNEGTQGANNRAAATARVAPGVDPFGDDEF